MEELLPARPAIPDQPVSAEIPDELLSTLALLRSGPLRSIPLRPLPLLPWHEATKEALDTCSFSPICHGLSRIALYTDGSGGTLYEDYTYYEHAAWSYVVIGWTVTNETTLIALDHGHVQHDPNKPDWSGAHCLNAMAGERAALISAAIWLLRSDFKGHAVFCFDSLAAGYGASGQWNTTPEASDATLLRVLFQVLERQSHLWISYEHVKAHTGDPWNECADTLAYEAWNKHKINPPVDVDLRKVLRGARPLCMHWPLIVATDCGVQIEHGYLEWYRDAAEPRPEVVWKHLPEARTTERSDLTLRFASFNVGTLSENKVGTGIAAFLRAQFSSQKVDVIGLQETRAQTTQVLRTDNFTRYISAADEHGSGGTEIWIATQGPLARILQHKQTAVYYQDKQTILMRLIAGGEEFCVLAAHAPHSGRPKDEIRSWWQALAGLYRRYVGGKMCIVLIDANAHFSTAMEPCIGQHGLERRENRCASCFAEFLQLTQLFLPATFATHHLGQTATWKNPKLGTLHRCDYIAVPQGWAAYSLQSWVDGCFELGRVNIDHLAVLIECKLPWMRGEAKRDWPQCAINRWQICNADSEFVQAFLQQLPKYDWSVNVHEHAAQMVGDLQQALSQHFPCRGKIPRSTYISERAWAIRAECRRYRRRLFFIKDTYARQLLSKTFYIWKHWHQEDMTSLMWHLQHPVGTMGEMIARLMVHVLGKRLKQQLYIDRRAHLDLLADDAAKSAPSEVYGKLRLLGVCGKRRRRAITPLPVVNEQAGHDDLHTKWRRHFEELEDGEEIDPVRLLQDCDRVQRSRRTIVPDFAELPTLLELEHSFRANKRGESVFLRQHSSGAGSCVPSTLGAVLFSYDDETIAPDC